MIDWLGGIRHSVSEALAERMCSAALDEVRATAGAGAVAIVDEGGILKTLAALPRTSQQMIQVATDKAYTGAAFKLPTDMWYDFIKGDPPLTLSAAKGVRRLVTVGGGYPITVRGEVVGGIGVSTGDWRIDMRSAQAGLSILSERQGGVSHAMALYLDRAYRLDVPSPADRHHAKRAIINALAAGLGALQHPLSERLAEWASSSSALTAGTRVIWLPLETSPERAALINGALLHVLDFDDTHISTVVHMTSPILGALLASCQTRQVTGERLLDSYLAGVDVAASVAAMLMPSHYRRGFHVTPIAGAIGAAAAVSVMMGLTPAQTSNGLAIAANLAGGLKENFGSMAKALGVGNAARNGLVSAEMAECGMTAAETAFEGSAGLVAAMSDYNPERAHGGLSVLGARSAVKDIALKRFPTGVAMHAPLDAVLELRRQRGDDSELSSMRFEVDPLVEEHWRRATGLQADGRELADPLEAKFSFKYCVAFAWTHGFFDLSSMSRAHYQDPRIHELMKRVEIIADRRVTMNGCRLQIRTTDGAEHKTIVMHHRGSPANRLSDTEISDKFRTIANSAGGSLGAMTDQTLETLWDLERLDDASSLTDLLSLQVER